MPRQLRREDYTVGWVCALPVELAAAQEMLDEEHDTVPCEAHDTNIYTCGSIGDHNVVVACLPSGQTGTGSAATAASLMRSSFTYIRFGLMVGIGGGVPSEDADIRLGDVVVSSPYATHGGVVQYDFGKATPSGFKRTGSLNAPPTILLNAVSKLQSIYIRRKEKLQDHLSRLEVLAGFGRSAAGPDVLFNSTYDHIGGRTCDECDTTYIVQRQVREQEIVVHYGTIASGNQVIRSARERQRVSADLGGILCFEMEAAGLMNSFPCLVIRGVCDYADSHKNKRWQPYAAGTAAAYTKELLLVIPAADVTKTRRAEDAMSGADKRPLQSPSPDPGPSKRRKPGIRDCTDKDTAEQHTVTLPIHHQDRTHKTLSKEQREDLLESLGFDQIDARQMTIKTAHAKTCKWLLKNDQYIQWNDVTKLVDHHGFLWIKGKAGTGKSTLMKFAVANARRSMKDCLVLSFFFNARGEDLEKSTTGTYRSLLIQLLKPFPALQSVFDALPVLSASKLGADHQWTVEPLQALLEQAIRSLGDSPVICFIDALDECDEKQVRGMIQFFEHIGDLALSSGVRFQVCFSSRHYPHITIRHGLELVLEGHEGHTQDIASYIDSELTIGKSKLAQQVRVELQEKASGIFMWVVLVVNILNKESDRGQVHKLRRKLQEIPGDLNDLFHDILTRDADDEENLILCIQWVLFANKPFSPEQLYYAILSGTDPAAVTARDPEEVTEDVIQRFILDSSKGLTETTVSKDRRIQFIHESVRDFLLKENGLGKIWPEYVHNFQGQSHERLKQCCLNHVRIDVATPLRIPDNLPKASSQPSANLRESAKQAFPFLEYAVHNIFHHADSAEHWGISQMGFLDSFPLPQWVKLDNLLENREVRRHTKGVSLLYLLAELDMADLIRALKLAPRCMDVETERYGCPLLAAAATNSRKALDLFTSCIDKQRSENDIIAAGDDQRCQQITARPTASRNFAYSKSRSFLQNVVELGHDEVIACFIRLGEIGAEFQDVKGVTLSRRACESGWVMSVRSLLATNSAIVNSKTSQHRNLLCMAAASGHKTLVNVLLEHDADVNAHGGEYSKALRVASEKGYTEIARLLLERGADIHANTGYDGNTLQAALNQTIDNKEVIELLLDNRANVNAQGGYFGNALQAASATGNSNQVIQLLLDKGASVNAQGGHYGSALQAASRQSNKEVVRLLLKHGADVNAQGGYYGNALQAASATRDSSWVVQLLLDKGASVNAQGGYYGSALQAASQRGNEEVVRLLLEHGADVNAQGGHYGNALQAASACFWNKEVVELLLDKGADVNAQGGYHGHALQAAASIYGNKEAVRLLLEHGADVNAQGGHYGHALQAAASTYGNKEVVRLLLEHGADVNAQGGNHQSALQAALHTGDRDTIALLKSWGAKD